VNAVRLALLYRVMVDALFDDLVRALREEIHSREKNLSTEATLSNRHASQAEKGGTRHL